MRQHNNAVGKMKEKTYLTWYMRLQSAAAAAGISYKYIAQRMGRDPSTISLYMRGKRNPDIHDLAHMCDIIGVEPNYILLEKESAQAIGAIRRLFAGIMRMEDQGIIDIASAGRSAGSSCEAMKIEKANSNSRCENAPVQMSYARKVS